tara:strand:- start:297 stop:530 length:234 start_codon:yes stop_codon:yes gene_type:complete
MEMLNIIVTAILAFVAWIAMSIVDLKTETAVINQKVSENHKMLSVLWDDFLEKKNDNLAWINGKADIKATAETKKTF